MKTSNQKNRSTFRIAGLATMTVLFGATLCSASVRVVSEHLEEGSESFTKVPPVSKTDAASSAKFSIVSGAVDSPSGGIRKLRDGALATEPDQPDENFFFEAGTEGGRLLLDVGRVIEVKQVNTYSRHPSTRGPQVYKLYGSDNESIERPKSGDPAASGWKKIAEVDTRPKTGTGGGQYGVSISESDGVLGKFRYLLFDVSRTEADDDWGNTFYSEIDVIENGATDSAVASAPEKEGKVFVVKSADGYCEISIDTTKAGDLTEWAEQKLAPVLAEWYPKITKQLASEGFEPPKKFTITFRPGRPNEVAATGRDGVTANSTWIARELNREAIGAILHEEVHVVQRYGGSRRGNPDAKPAPGWLVEGIPDYIRWFLYEPQSHGADLIWLQARRNVTLNYDARYRITANFLNYVVENHDKDKSLVTKINAACRQGKYTDEIWKKLTGKELAQLNDEWKAETQKQLATKAESKINSLTDAEKAAGWKLLFNGVDFAGWHNFKHEGVRPGWQVKDGALVCADPHDAGDIVTTEKFGAFELELDYKISEGGNSGIIFHVTDEGGAVWATGPELQLEDNAAAKDPQRCGWLYALYQPADDPTTGKPLDATKPAGEWNHVRLVISPEKCEHWINGVKYFEYVIGSDDFKERVAKSKFGKMPLFAKADAGYIALQGDHGQVSFRDIKVRPLGNGRS